MVAPIKSSSVSQHTNKSDANTKLPEGKVASSFAQAMVSLSTAATASDVSASATNSLLNPTNIPADNEALAKAVSNIASTTIVSSSAAAATTPTQPLLPIDQCVYMVSARPFEEIDVEDQKTIKAISEALAKDRFSAQNVTETESTASNLNDGLFNKILSCIPASSPQSANSAVVVGEKTFSSCGVFPAWLSWGFVVYRLLKKYSPADAEIWPRILNHLKYSYHLIELKNELEHFPEEAIYDIAGVVLLHFAQGFSELYKRCAGRLSKHPKIQDLLDQLTLWRDVVSQNHALYPLQANLDKQENYEQILEFMGFVDKFARLSAGKNSLIIKVNQIQKPIFNWQNIFPPRLIDLKLKNKRLACVREMNIAYSYVKGIKAELSMIISAKKTGGLMLATSSGRLHPESSKVVQANQAGAASDLYYYNAYSLNHKVYSSLFHAMQARIADENLFGAIATTCLSAKIKKIGENRKLELIGQRNTAILKQGLTVVNKFCEANKWEGDLKKILANLFFNMESYLKKGPIAFSFYLKSLKEGTYRTGFELALNAGCPYLIFQYLQIELHNLSSVIEKLGEFRRNILEIIKKDLQPVPHVVLVQHFDQIQKCIEELHVVAAGPVIDFLELLFASARILDEEQFILKNDNRIMPPGSIARQVIDFLALVDLKKVIKSVRKSLDPIKRKRDLNNAATQSNSRIEALYADLAALPPSGKSFEDVAATASTKPISRKAKRSAAAATQKVVSNVVTGAAIASAATATGVAITSAAKIVSEVENNDDNDLYEVTPKKMADLIDLLEHYGYYLLREGHRHSIYKAEGKESIAVPRHKTGASGTMKKIKNQAVRKE